MSIPAATERQLLTAPEAEMVGRSHYPDVGALDRPALIDMARQLRAYRDKARDVGRGRRRERRGKAEPRGGSPARHEAGLTVKMQIFASALRRVNSEIARREAMMRRQNRSQGEIAAQALEMKRAARQQRHPRAGRTAHHGMRPVESAAVEGTVDPRVVGSISQQNKDFQGASDR